MPMVAQSRSQRFEIAASLAFLLSFENCWPPLASLMGNSNMSFGCLLLVFQGFKGSQGQKFLDVFEVFLGIFEKTTEKKDRVRKKMVLRRFPNSS